MATPYVQPMGRGRGRIRKRGGGNGQVRMLQRSVTLPMVTGRAGGIPPQAEAPSNGSLHTTWSLRDHPPSWGAPHFAQHRIFSCNLEVMSFVTCLNFSLRQYVVIKVHHTQESFVPCRILPLTRENYTNRSCELCIIMFRNHSRFQCQ